MVKIKTSSKDNFVPEKELRYTYVNQIRKSAKEPLQTVLLMEKVVYVERMKDFLGRLVKLQTPILISLFV